MWTPRGQEELRVDTEEHKSPKPRDKCDKKEQTINHVEDGEHRARKETGLSGLEAMC